MSYSSHQHNKLGADYPETMMPTLAAPEMSPRQPKGHSRPLMSIPAESGGIIRRACSACDDEAQASVSPKLEVGAANDPAEREADAVADQVMSMSSSGQSANSNLAATGDIGTPAPIRMKEGGSPGGGSFQASGSAAQAINSLSGGSPLPASDRQFFEPRFGRDLSHVRLHTGAAANSAAKGINARAFTRGSEISFASGEYNPGTTSGRHLMAHELAHTMQGGNNVRRVVEVLPNLAALSDIVSQFNQICPAGNFAANGTQIQSNCASSSSSGCDCLCEVASDPSRTYTIQVEDVTNVTKPVRLWDRSRVTVPYPSNGPHTTGSSVNPTIVMPSTSNSALEFGAFDASGTSFVANNWRILAHELCGHARLGQSYSGSKGNRPQHDSTINTTNIIAGEHSGTTQRGVFSDLRQGESFHKLPGGSSKLVFMLRNGWHYEHV